MGKIIQKIVPNLWFDKEAKEAAEFYTSVFQNSDIGTEVKYGNAGQEIHGQKPGSTMTVDFEIENFRFLGLNGGPIFKFNPSISFFVLCETDDEIENLWKKLSEKGEILMPLDAYEWSPKYGWLQDKFGLNWQLMGREKKKYDQKIFPLLFFTGERQGKAEEAIKFYTSVFKNSEITGILHYGEENDFARNGVKHAEFRLEDQVFMAMDSGMENNYPFNEAISFIVKCRDQQEIDFYWEKLTEGGDPKAQICGWLKDKFGVSWQIVPEGMERMLNYADKEKAQRAMEAVLKMKKFDMNLLKRAVEKSPLT
ncbi:MAG TPA: VOC family protein [Salinimicrobium sp.]|nr:VOC family protein [Salinimicrobium sp.]